MTTIITLTARNGTEQEISKSPDATMMEAIRDAGFDELLAICGACRSCPTCHVYVGNGDHRLPPMSPDEDDLLDSSDHRTTNSRLSCQLRLQDTGDGLRIRIARED